LLALLFAVGGQGHGQGQHGWINRGCPGSCV